MTTIPPPPPVPPQPVQVTAEALGMALGSGDDKLRSTAFVLLVWLLAQRRRQRSDVLTNMPSARVAEVLRGPDCDPVQARRWLMELSDLGLIKKRKPRATTIVFTKKGLKRLGLDPYR